MKSFMSEDFLLQSETARKLYFGYAKDQPIVDWHCHIPPKEIEQDRRFDSITQMWLEADHYKWRAMRLCGVDEKYITGGAGEREKYDMWVKTVNRCIGNPLYHWTHLELARCFGISEPLNEKNADAIWEKANRQITSDGFSARGIIKKFNVRAIFTTDDPADDLNFHRRMKNDPSFETGVFPAFRPDKALNIRAGDFTSYIERLAAAAGTKIKNFDDLKQALSVRMDFFKEMGCRASDQSFSAFPFAAAAESEVKRIFGGALEGKVPNEQEAEKFQTVLMCFMAEEYEKRGWAMELHIGAMRNNNTKMFESIGPDTGFDSINDRCAAEKLSRFLDAVAVRGCLPKTVLFTLNPKDNAVLGSMCGNFSSKTDGRVQFGTAWWFNDNRDGMETQIKCYSNLGVLANFIGMLTDSRSFLSYPRHEYFRRILCNILGGWVENGEYPADYDTLGEIVRGICCGNALRYFGLS